MSKFPLKKVLFFSLALAALVLAMSFTFRDRDIREITKPVGAPEHKWQVKSVDTMKQSRDLALNKREDPNFETTINLQTKQIADLGANYIAIATPYDSEFTPMLRMWVDSARRNNLKIWFRGNFSGWEGWFEYPKTLTREEHIAKTKEFISKNPDLFADGDIFTACPECENGGPGDPRHQTSVTEYRKFMIDERRAVDEEFKNLGKHIHTNYNSTNLDVAKVVYDSETVRAMDGLIVVDHYTKSPDEFVKHVSDLAKEKQSRVMLGEIGVPIKNITGEMTEEEQAAWLERALKGVAANKNIIGVNWWVNVGGETALFRDNGNPVRVKYTLEKFYKIVDLSKVN